MIGLLYDIHGNLAALEAVLGDAKRVGVRRYVLGGDYALFGPRPAETVQGLRGLDGDWIRGNGERWTATPASAPDDGVVQGAIEACQDELGEEVVAELAGLPESIRREGAVYCHGSPVSDVRSFWPEPADDEEELLAGVDTDRLLFGHTHLPFARRSRPGDMELVNPGSVGMPFDRDPRAAYAVLREDGTVEHRRVAYDHQAVATELRERFGAGFADTVARRIELARVDV